MTDHGAYYWIRHAFFRRYARAEVPCKHDAQWQCFRVSTNFLHADSKILFEFANFACIVAIKNIKIFISKVWG